jgi:hypothetical protein
MAAPAVKIVALTHSQEVVVIRQQEKERRKKNAQDLVPSHFFH